MPTDTDDANVTSLEGRERTGRRRRTPESPADQAHPAAPRRRAGRPLKLTPEVVGAIGGVLRTGLSIKDACQVVGISVTACERYRTFGEEALAVAIAETGVDGDDYDADELLAAVPEDRRIYVEFLWEFDHADAVGVSELAHRLQRTNDPRVQLALLRARRPERFTERVAIDASLVIEESQVRGIVTERLNRLAGALDTTATEGEGETPPPALDSQHSAAQAPVG